MSCVPGSFTYGLLRDYFCSLPALSLTIIRQLQWYPNQELNPDMDVKSVWSGHLTYWGIEM